MAICKWDPILPLNRSSIQTCNTVIYIFNIRITIWMLHKITKRLEICIDFNIEISEVDHYTWLFTSRIFRLGLEITFLLNKYFFLQMLLSQSRKRNKRGSLNKSERAWKIFWKNISERRTLIRGSRVTPWRKSKTHWIFHFDILSWTVWRSSSLFIEG